MEIKVPKEVRQYHESIFFSGCRCGSLDARLPLWEQRWGCILDVWIRLERKRRAGYVFWGAAPLALAGFFTYNGMPLEKFLWAVFKSQVLRARPRVFRAKNYCYIFFFVKKGGWKNQPPFSNTSGKKEKRRMKQKWKRYSASFLALLLCVTLFASTAFAAGGGLGADRNGTPYTYVIGYMYSGSSQTVNTREIFTSPNNYDIWLCPVCGRDPLGNSQGTALSPNLYMPCYGYDIAAAGGDMSIRYALVRHRHNNGQLSDDKVYIPVNVPMYAGCYYGYDLTEPAGVQVSAPTGWQRTARWCVFRAARTQARACRTGARRRATTAAASITTSISINGGAWTGCPWATPP